MPSAFYVSEGGRFVSTELTRGPWDPGSQHAGPPAALIGRALERSTPEGWAIGRITFEILRAVPIAPLQVEVETLRAGRSVELVGAVLRDADGEPLIRAHAWRLAERPLELPEGLRRPPIRCPRSSTAPTIRFSTPARRSATTRRWSTGSSPARSRELGPATVWMRMRYPLIEGEPPSPLQRLLTAADTVNGASATLDLQRYLFVNVDLSLHVYRLPVGEWVCLDAITIPQPTGIGMAETVLHDERGPLGRALQTLLIRER